MFRFPPCFQVRLPVFSGAHGWGRAVGLVVVPPLVRVSCCACGRESVYRVALVERVGGGTGELHR